MACQQRGAGCGEKEKNAVLPPTNDVVVVVSFFLRKCQGRQAQRQRVCLLACVVVVVVAVVCVLRACVWLFVAKSLTHTYTHTHTHTRQDKKNGASCDKIG